MPPRREYLASGQWVARYTAESGFRIEAYGHCASQIGVSASGERYS